jgi:sec-independent protein translocase protein TatA
MNMPEGFELFAILAVLVLLFGSKKLPDAARALGRSMRIFKAETKGLRGGDAESSRPLLGESPEDRERREYAEFKEWQAKQRSADSSDTRS